VRAVESGGVLMAGDAVLDGFDRAHADVVHRRRMQRHMIAFGTMPKNVSGSSGSQRAACGRLAVPHSVTRLVHRPRGYEHLGTGPAPEAGAAGESKSTQPTSSRRARAAPRRRGSSRQGFRPRSARRRGAPSRSFLSRSVRLVMHPSMPKPPIAAWKRSAFSSRLARRRAPSGGAARSARTWSPSGPTFQLFLPWMFIAARPAERDAHGAGHNRRPPAVLDHVAPELAIVTPGSATTMPAAGSQARMRFMRERSRQTCSAFSAASP